ncbi:MAG: methylmalonyl Co-A mutase-associated GTPase MeaB [Deltaproteobacteria bacterium]|nr:methylmalonyl Co-A mutase-associated GTPase MeaB [Deltaproteobacteria bacterium]
MPWKEYFERFLQKDRLATGRLINILESDEDRGLKRELMKACAAQKRDAYVVGITGVPGAGKSTLIDGLGCWLLDQGYTLGVICVDPSSPFRGGAILGDRVRFRNLNRRPGAFIRSMATRGHLGGLGTATRDVIQLLEAGGFDVIIVETVGTGQTEVEIVSAADTVILVTVPGLGDQMQVVKAGIMEIGDIFVVNQSDRPGAEETASRLKNELVMFGDRDGWTPVVIPTVATKGEGIPFLGEAVIRRKEFLVQRGQKQELHKRRKIESWSRLLEERFAESLGKFLQTNAVGKEVRRKVESGEIDIYEASERVWEDVLRDCCNQ